MNIDFDKLFLVRDSEYGTHVTYINEYPYKIYLDYFSENDDFNKIIKELNEYIKEWIDDKNEL